MKSASLARDQHPSGERERTSGACVTEHVSERGAGYTAHTIREVQSAHLSSSRSAPAAHAQKPRQSRTTHEHHRAPQSTNKQIRRAHTTRPPRARRFIQHACGARNSRCAETRGQGTQESLSELYYKTAPTQPISLVSVSS